MPRPIISRMRENFMAADAPPGDMCLAAFGIGSSGECCPAIRRPTHLPYILPRLHPLNAQTWAIGASSLQISHHFLHSNDKTVLLCLRERSPFTSKLLIFTMLRHPTLPQPDLRLDGYARH